MIRLFHWLVSLLFPPKLPVIVEFREKVSGYEPEQMGDGIVGRVKPRKYRDGIDRHFREAAEHESHKVLILTQRFRISRDDRTRWHACEYARY